MTAFLVVDMGLTTPQMNLRHWSQKQEGVENRHLLFLS